MECLVQQCPPSLHTGFMRLFPGVSVDAGSPSHAHLLAHSFIHSLFTGDLLVITLCEKTINDMTSWSRSVEEEREQLMQHVRMQALEASGAVSHIIIVLCSLYTTFNASLWHISHTVCIWIHVHTRTHIAQFIETAKEICARLSSASVWADFIDPYSGRAVSCPEMKLLSHTHTQIYQHMSAIFLLISLSQFYSPHSNEILSETDERFRYLGFDVRDLGCCRSIAHPTFSSHAFVGTIFCSTSIDSPSIQSILQL